MMKHNRWIRLYEAFVQLLVYPLLVLIGVMALLTCGLVVALAFRLTDTAGSPPVARIRRLNLPAASYPRSLKILPSPNPTATDTSTIVPSPTFTALPTPLPASAAIAAVNPAPEAIPVVYPTSDAIPAATPTSGAIPVIYPTPGSPPPRPNPTVAPSPTITPTATLTPPPEYDFMLAEFFNSPTTNSFIMIYVAIVDTNEIPIGDMKVVGTRLDQDLIYESPLSTWFFEGYSAPGQVVKSGNVKFEPPGAIETASWVLYLADAHGNRQSADIPFDMHEDDKQWYFIKFRRKY